MGFRRSEGAHCKAAAMRVSSVVVGVISPYSKLVIVEVGRLRILANVAWVSPRAIRMIDKVVSGRLV